MSARPGSEMSEARAEPEAMAATTVPGAKLVRGIWLPATERHFADMLEHHSKIGDVDGKGTYQLHKLRQAMGYIGPLRRRVAVDVGAHVGLWAMHMVKDFERVVAFEPVPLHRRLFALNVPAGKYEIHACALGRVPGRVRITVPPGTTGSAHVVVGERLAGEKRGPTVEAEVRTLDSFGLEAVDFVKIDVEGFELEVLRGAEATLLRCRPYVIVEQKKNDERNFGRPKYEALAWLEAMGWRRTFEYGGDFFLSAAEG